MKYMDIKEFMDLGYLQEANRQFFHLLGLALVVGQDAVGNWVLYGIMDKRDDPEGVIFAEGVIDRAKFERVALAYKDVERFKRLGYVVQPVK